MNRLRTPLLAIVSAATAIALVACDEDVLRDPNFRLWCGDRLCAWQLESGRIERVPTWHQDDYGARFVDTPTAISQLVTKAPKCLRFTSVAKLDPSAQMALELDFDDDGSVDYTYPIPSSDWREVQTLVTAPLAFDRVRFRIVKRGAGEAILAMMRVESTDSCEKSQAVVLHDLPLGQLCGDGAECASGVCCGFLAPVCSTCCPAEACQGAGCPAPTCAGGVACGTEPGGGIAFPFLCGPGKGNYPSGAPCVADADCASGACDGVRTINASTELNLSADAGCPDGPDAGPTCAPVRAIAGTCR